MHLFSAGSDTWIISELLPNIRYSFSELYFLLFKLPTHLYFRMTYFVINHSMISTTKKYPNFSPLSFFNLFKTLPSTKNNHVLSIREHSVEMLFILKFLSKTFTLPESYYTFVKEYIPTFLLNQTAAL